MNIDVEIEKCPVDQLIPRPANPRTHSDRQVEQVAASIHEFGWTNPILVGADNDVIAGHAWVCWRLVGSACPRSR